MRKAHEFSLDAPQHGGDETTQTPRIENVPRLPEHDRGNCARESRRVLEEVLSELPNRSRQVLESLRDGKTYAEIGKRWDSANKPRTKSARTRFTVSARSWRHAGFAGIDSKGFLKSAHRDKPG